MQTSVTTKKNLFYAVTFWIFETIYSILCGVPRFNRTVVLNQKLFLAAVYIFQSILKPCIVDMKEVKTKNMNDCILTLFVGTSSFRCPVRLHATLEHKQ